MREDVDLAGGRIQGSFERYVKPLLLGSRSVIDEIQALLDDGIDIDDPVLARALTRVQQHVLDDGTRRFAVLHDLFQIAAQRVSVRGKIEQNDGKGVVLRLRRHGH